MKHVRSSSRVVVLLSLLIHLGCGSSGGASSASDAGARDGAEGRDSGKAAGTVGSGFVTVQQSIDTNNGMITYLGTVSASFYATAPKSSTSSCTTTTDGSCQVEVCETMAPPPPPGDASAGTLKVSGTSLPVSLPPNADGSYSPFQTSSTGGPFIKPTGTITVSASGAAVPAFTGSVSFSGPLTLTSPAIHGVTAHLPTGDVPVAWTGGDQLQLFLSANAAGAGGGSAKTAAVTCVFSGGSGTVSASAMASLANLGSLAAGPVATTTVTAGDLAVTIKAQAITTVGVFTK
jgi:hypothetical protein